MRATLAFLIVLLAVVLPAVGPTASCSGADDGPGAAARAPGSPSAPRAQAEQMSVAELIRAVSRDPAPSDLTAGRESAVNARLTEVTDRGPGYQAAKADEPALLAAMKDERLDLPARLCVARFLLDLNNADARRFIAAQLEGKDPATLDNPVYALLAAANGEADDWATGQLLKVLPDERLRTRPIEEQGSRDTVYDACRTLGDLKSKAAVPVLIDLLRRYPEERGAAIALGEIGDASAVPVLLETLVTPPGAWRHLRAEQAWALHDLGADKDLFPVLVRHLDNYCAIDLLVEIKDPRAVAPLREYLGRNPHGPGRDNIFAPQPVQVSVAIAQLEAKDPADLAARLTRLLAEETDPRNAIYFVRPLGSTRSRAAVEPLGRIAASTRDSFTFGSTVDALGEIGGTDAARALVGLFERDLSKIGYDRPANNDAIWRPRIARALRRATGQNLGPDAAKWKAWLATNPAFAPASQPAQAPPR